MTSRHVPFICDGKGYEQYYSHQAGHGIPVFIGGRNYRGSGLGNILGGIGRSLLPVLKSAGKSILGETLRTGAQIAGDVLGGSSFKKAVGQRGRQAGQRLLQKAVRRVTSRRPPPPPPINAKTRGQRRQKRKRRASGAVGDIFD